MKYFNVTVSAGSIAEREQRVQDLLDRGFELVKYMDQEITHGKNYSRSPNKLKGLGFKYEESYERKKFGALLRKQNAYE